MTQSFHWVTRMSWCLVMHTEYWTPHQLNSVFIKARVVSTWYTIISIRRGGILFVRTLSRHASISSLISASRIWFEGVENFLHGHCRQAVSGSCRKMCHQCSRRDRPCPIWCHSHRKSLLCHITPNMTCCMSCLQLKRLLDYCQMNFIWNSRSSVYLCTLTINA